MRSTGSSGHRNRDEFGFECDGKPGAGVRPPGVGGAGRHADDFGALVELQAALVPQLDEFRDFWLLDRQPRQGFVERLDTVSSRREAQDLVSVTPVSYFRSSARYLIQKTMLGMLFGSGVVLALSCQYIIVLSFFSFATSVAVSRTSQSGVFGSNRMRISCRPGVRNWRARKTGFGTPCGVPKFPRLRKALNSEVTASLLQRGSISALRATKSECRQVSQNSLVLRIVV